MYLKVLDFLTVKIESPPEKHLKYLSSEFVLLNENDLSKIYASYIKNNINIYT